MQNSDEAINAEIFHNHGNIHSCHYVSSFQLDLYIVKGISRKVSATYIKYIDKVVLNVIKTGKRSNIANTILKELYKVRGLNIA